MWKMRKMRSTNPIAEAIFMFAVFAHVAWDMDRMYSNSPVTREIRSNREEALKNRKGKDD